MIIEINGQRPAMCIAVKGFRAFVEAITTHRPSVPVHLGWFARFVERMPGRSRVRTA